MKRQLPLLLWPADPENGLYLTSDEREVVVMPRETFEYLVKQIDMCWASNEPLVEDVLREQKRYLRPPEYQSYG